MAGKIETGSIITGKVTGIQPYGAFVALDENTQGLVHISEITHGFVKDINDHLKVGDEIKVKVLSVDEEAGKIGLSVKATEEPPAQQQVIRAKKPRRRQAAAIISEGDEGQQGFNTLKEKLQEWIDQSQREDLIRK
ncbi:general stress protein 13 [Bacillus sp. BRMEA1]|uniref:S1 domain-containing post-transcriptional regulator GSP13 n=1 Tax=Neobacillus endophyticus TaxID=2738405 RepID=UPI0015653DC0|nr:S1 domain-containing post-transcriptional regulator GSP13 [Neobacillus endophyticus]NRD76373.1 general stress protein 13 [Neobacillus endophyticus]